MKLSDLSKKSRETAAKIAAANGITPEEVLRHIIDISSRRRVSKHSRHLFVSDGCLNTRRGKEG